MNENENDRERTQDVDERDPDRIPEPQPGGKPQGEPRDLPNKRGGDDTPPARPHIGKTTSGGSSPNTGEELASEGRT